MDDFTFPETMAAALVIRMRERHSYLPLPKACLLAWSTLWRSEKLGPLAVFQDNVDELRLLAAVEAIVDGKLEPIEPSPALIRDVLARIGAAYKPT